jgi:hypothetical protein
VRFLGLLLLLVPHLAQAHPPPPPPPLQLVEPAPGDWRGPENAALFEWSSWVRLGVGVASERPPVVVRSTVGPAGPTQHTTWQGAAGVELTVPVGQTPVRFGPWIELRGLDAFIGGEVAITGAPAHLDRFFYDGEGALSLRAGGGAEAATASLAWGYRCPWRLAGPFDRHTRYMIGARVVATMTRAYRDPADWSATLGLELEPVGALRYLLGVRSWY